MSRCIKVIFIMFLMSLFLNSLNFVSASEGSERVVKLQDGISVEDFLTNNNLSLDDIQVGKSGYILIKSTEAGILNIEQLDGVDSIQKDEEAFIQSSIPDDWFYDPEQWNMSKIGMEEVWDDYRGSEDVLVAVLDTGLNFDHEDMVDVMWRNLDEIPGNDIDDDNNGFVDDYNGYNFVKSNTKISDDNDHGTAVSSIIVANSNNEIGIAGINWQAKIMPVKVASSSGSASLFDIAQGIYYAVDNGAKIINMSLGSMIDKDYVREAVEYASDNNVLMVAASGNSDSFSFTVNTLYYPARYPEVMAVGATGRDDKIATLSNSSYLSHHSEDLDLVAPGVEIVTADSSSGNDGYKYFDGTSMSSPHVAGAAALMLSKNKNLPAAELRNYLNLSAKNVDAMSEDFDSRYGNGRLDVNAAMKMIASDGGDDPVDPIDPVDPVDPGGDDEYGNVYLAQWKSQSNYWYVKPGEKRTVWVEFENIGDALWEKDGNTALHFATDRSKDRSSDFYDSATWLTANRLEMVQDEVKPGEVARFEFEIKAPYQVGDYKEYFALVAENTTWLNDMGVYWDFHVTNDDVYSAWWNDQSEYLNINVDETGSSWIEFINDGTVYWDKDGYNAVHLGTDRSMDRSSQMFDSDSWLTSNRIEMDLTTVAPGEVARFSFDVKGNKMGFYREYFRPVVENISWFKDWGVFLDYWVVDNAVG